MKTCRDCFHYTPCWRATSVAVRQHTEHNEIVDYCADFCDRSRVALLPVGLGETVYLFERGKITEARVVEASGDIAKDRGGWVFAAESEAGHRFFNNDDLGEAVHLTREAAEAELALRKDKQA